ncbi:MAG TPA: hypothetical protein VFB31_19680 [Pseudolabrys sp.]|nr:hypothetical protein [Pseudolabrys sp.]
MTDVALFADGGYRYLKGVFQYSAGVTAEPGFEIERARLRQPLALAQAIPAIEAHLRARGRPLAALCACELRSPAPFTERGFTDFNRDYVRWLEDWNLFRDGINPVARTNVCPAVNPPEEVVCYAFSYTMPAVGLDTSFVVAGSGEAPEGKSNYRDYAIRLGDRSAGAIRDKAQWVLAEMERRMSALGFKWKDSTGTHLYTVYDVHPFIAEEIAARGAMANGLSWHYSRPPVQDLDYEMDVRGVCRELVI